MSTAIASATVQETSRTPHRALLARIPTDGQSAWQLSHSHSLPTLSEDQVLIRTSYVALNPFDWQGVEFKYGIGEKAKVMGRDGAGDIVAIGRKVERFKLGDRVWFCANSSASDTGAFQEYSVHSASEIGHTPNHLSDQAAATLGTGLITAGVALFRTLGLSINSLSVSTKATRKENAPWVLIWGGAGITGVYLIELARLLGYRVICSASPANHEYVRSLGADVVLDRWSNPKELVETIRKETKDQVHIAIDNVGGATAALCRQVLQGSLSWRSNNNVAMDEDDKLPAELVPIAGSPKDTDDNGDSIREVTSLRISFSTTFYGHPEFSEALLDRYDKLLEARLLTPARIRLVDGGLYGIEKGLEDLRHGRVPGGYKLVARLADTPEPTTINVQRQRQDDDAQVGAKRTWEIQDVVREQRTAKRFKDDVSSPQEEAEVEPGPRSTRSAIIA
ncbi:uncharacterized protein IL334_004495 [Kwoniella shivajii]|uniref:Enoyl reductase (ER) domain-containing protein n=1 Tax=Kwoniella shivajii TaxID=564305 RepID=A0ABZ1D0H4_9TREE|nr:hypothetical protein IL334_004495 [Kwoniella shivajii]